MKTPKINTKRGFNIVFNKNIDSYGNMIEFPNFYYKGELYSLYTEDNWDTQTIYKNNDFSKVIEIYPKFINNNRRFKKVVIYDFS